MNDWTTSTEWRDVADASAFCQFLERFRSTLDAPAGALSSPRPWQQAGVHVYLHGWARWLESIPVEHLPISLDPPSWSSLAFQMLSVRDAKPPVAEMDAPRVRRAKSVKDVITFARWLRHLGDECIEDHALLKRQEARGWWAGETNSEDCWRHGTDLDGYLEAWSACLLDTDPKPNLAWADVAHLVTMGKYYE